MSNTSKLPLSNTFKSLALGLMVASQWGLGMIAPALGTTLTKTQIETASQILCQALESGRSPEAARDAATAYLIEQGGDKKQLSPSTIRQQMRPVVTKQCPDQARKLKNL
jgi:hypothetical protein